MNDADAEFALERRRERLAVGDGHGAVDHDLLFLPGLLDETLVAVGALVQVDLAVRGRRGGGRLGH